VHYNIARGTSSQAAQLIYSPPQNPAGGSAPTGVEQSHSSPWDDQIDRNAIGDRHGQEDSWRGTHPPVYSLDLDPPAAGIQAHHLDAVHLIAQRDGHEFRQLAAERAPAAHHLTNRCLTPEAEIEPATGLGAAAGDAGNDTVAFAPIGNFESWDISCDGRLANLNRL
jgi:hypothetical protein